MMHKQCWLIAWRVVIAGLVLLFVWSRFYDCAIHMPVFGRLIVCCTRPGQISVTVVFHPVLRQQGFDAYYTGAEPALGSGTFLGWTWLPPRLYDSDAARSTVYLSLPWVILGTFACERWMLLRRAPANAGRCCRCGYDLRGNVSGTCPECGKATAIL